MSSQGRETPSQGLSGRPCVSVAAQHAGSEAEAALNGKMSACGSTVGCGTSAQLLGCLQRVWKEREPYSRGSSLTVAVRVEILIRADLTSSSEIREPVNSDHKIPKNPQGHCRLGAGPAPHEMAAPSDAAVTPLWELGPHPDHPGAQLGAGSLSEEGY